jgi:hypothetical protein
MNPAVAVMIEVARPKITKREVVPPPASCVMTFKCTDCGRERFNPNAIPLGVAVIAGPGNIVACSCGDGCIERCAR